MLSSVPTLRKADAAQHMALTRRARPSAQAAVGTGTAAVPDYADHLRRTRDSLSARLRDAPAGDVLREYFARGKMLRAYLVFAAASAVGGEPGEVVMAAEAIELLHGASLFHDDIIDGAAERRGLQSLHERLGMGPALVVGDDLLIRAFGVLAEAESRHPAARVFEASAALNQLARSCCRGQFDEVCADRWISENDYLAIVRGKTAAPFIAAGMLGAILGGGTRTLVERIRIYASELGVAFQIGDDLNDLTGHSQALGKPAGNSLARGRPMLPLIHLWSSGDDAARGAVARLAGGDIDRCELVAILAHHGILDRVVRTQQQYVHAALAAVEGFPNADGVTALRALAARALESAALGG